MSGDTRIHVEEEYSAQLHRLQPQKVCREVIKTMKLIVDEGVDGIVKKLNQVSPGCDSEAASSQLKAECYANVDRHGPELMAAITAALEVPRNVVLPEDAVQMQQFTDKDLDNIYKKTLDLKRRMLYNKQLKEALLAESRILESVEAMKAKVIEWQEMCNKNRAETVEVEKTVNSSVCTENLLVRVSKRSIILSSVNSDEKG